jgi:hypothetical protein
LFFSVELSAAEERKTEMEQKHWWIFEAFSERGCFLFILVHFRRATVQICVVSGH